MIRPAPQHLLILGVIGVSSIWGFVGYWDGMFDNFDAIVSSGFLPDGRSMRRKYTGLKPFDDRLTRVIAFYEMLSNGQSVGPRMLFFDTIYGVAATNVWVLTESRRSGVKNAMLKYPFPFMLLWNLSGAALFQPFYFYAIIKSRGSRRDPTIPLGEAISLFVTTFPVIFSPLLLFGPIEVGFSTLAHHGLIAVFQFTPFLTALFFPSCASLLNGLSIRMSRFRRMGTGETPQKKHTDKPWIIASYILVGTIAAGAHLFTLTVASTTRNPDASISRLFVPSMERMAIANTVPLSWIGQQARSIIATKTVGGKYTEDLEQFHLFSQFDWAVVTISCTVFVHLLLCRARLQYPESDSRAARNKAPIANSAAKSELMDFVLLSLGTALVGPGAAGSLGLAVRETRLREKLGFEKKTQ